MKTWIIELPDNVAIKDGVISIAGNVGWSVIEKSIHNAKESVEVDQFKANINGKDGPILKMLSLDGQPVTLYAVKKDK
jgi:hypothetical protein